MVIMSIVILCIMAVVLYHLIGFLEKSLQKRF